MSNLNDNFHNLEKSDSPVSIIDINWPVFIFVDDKAVISAKTDFICAWAAYNCNH